MQKQKQNRHENEFLVCKEEQCKRQNFLLCKRMYFWCSLCTLYFPRMPGESYCRRLGSLLLCLFDVFRALISSLCADFFFCVCVCDILRLKTTISAARSFAGGTLLWHTLVWVTWKLKKVKSKNPSVQLYFPGAGSFCPMLDQAKSGFDINFTLFRTVIMEQR